MNSITLSLIGRGPGYPRDHVRALLNSARGPRGELLYHPLDRITRMMFRFRDWDREYMGDGEDLERVALLLDGNKLPDIGLKPSTHPAERHYYIPRMVVFRESPVSYRMRAVCLAVPMESADAFETELLTVKQYMTAEAVIGNLASIAIGRRENEKPPMSYAWDPHPISSSTDHTDIFVFLQVNRGDHPGLCDHRSYWIRLKRHYIFEGIVREDEPSEVQYACFGDLWPLLEKVSLITDR